MADVKPNLLSTGYEAKQERHVFNDFAFVIGKIKGILQLRDISVDLTLLVTIIPLSWKNYFLFYLFANAGRAEKDVKTKYKLTLRSQPFSPILSFSNVAAQTTKNTATQKSGNCATRNKMLSGSETRIDNSQPIDRPNQVSP